MQIALTMLVVFVLSLLAKRGTTTTVRAWSDQQQFIKQRGHPFTQQLRKSLSTTAQYLSSSKDNYQEEEKLIPKTGWGHNLPKKDSSFWENNSSSEKKNETRTDTSSSSAAKEPRTGWLHNTVPKKKQEKQQVPVNKINSELEKILRSTPAQASSPPTSDNTIVTAKKKTKEPRTGWLHNTVPKATIKQKKIVRGGSPVIIRGNSPMTTKQRNHRIISQPTFHSNGDSQFVVTEHKIAVPIFYNQEQKESEKEYIDIYFSILEIVDDNYVGWWKSLGNYSPIDRADLYVKKINLVNANGLMLFLQGGPGFGAPAPVSGLSLVDTGSWAGKALLGKYYQRVVLMDQRGTGKSTPITKQWLEQNFPDLFLLDAEDTPDLPTLEDLCQKDTDGKGEKVMDAVKVVSNFMAQFRADSIVRDAEEIKNALLAPFIDKYLDANQKLPPCPYGCALGQSYGGFCMMTYLSQIEYPPKVCLLTGGIAPMLSSMYEVYDKLWDRVKERNLRYYEMYPGDVQVVKKITNKLIEDPAKLPSGSKLTARRFLQTGLSLGGSPSSFARLHNLFNSAFLSGNDETNTANEEGLIFSRPFLKAMDSEHPFDDHPIYFLLHESIYANSAGDDEIKNIPTNWIAHRAYNNRIAQESSEFDYYSTCKLDGNNDDACPTLLFGEMVFPWMADGDYAECSGFGMRSLARALAEKDDWGPLYDEDHMKKVLTDGNISRAAAAVYYEDLYVDFDASMKVVQRGGPLEKCKVWITNEFQHSGLRDNGAAIFAKLHGIAIGKNRIPS